MRIYWINPPVSNFSIFADTAWMEISSACPSHEWIEPTIDWEKYNTIDQIIKDIDDAKPDIVCFSSYVWNEHLCIDIAKELKDYITVRGGPQQDDGFEYFDYACGPLDPGEPFMVDLLNKLSGTNDPGRSRKFCEDSSILNHSVYMTNVAGKAKELNKRAILHLETTRGCPYSCTYCEWGGGIGTKLFRKPIENVEQEIDLASMLGFDEIDIVDANFGILDRDVDIVHMLGQNKIRYGYPQQTNVYGVTKNKVKNKLRVLEPLAQYGMMVSFSVPMQSLTEEVKKNIKRTDTPVEETLRMSMYLKDTYDINPRLELIMGLPGTTLKDFYEEMDLVDWVKNWEWSRYPFSILPATEAANPFYRALHKIKSARMPLPMNDCDLDNYYRNPSIITKYRMLEEVAVSSYSYTREEYIEMFFMNYTQRVIGPRLNTNEKYSIQMKRIYEDIKTKDWFQPLYHEIDKLTKGERPYDDFLHHEGKAWHEWVEEYYYG
jgi:radical SAM superfamily enzyme YgiQ (UPF0313 family)